VAGKSRVAEAIAAFQRGELARARALATAEVDAVNGAPDAHHLLGLIDCREGRIDRGIGHLQAALAAEPDNPDFRLMLARALVDSGQLAEALALADHGNANPAAAAALDLVRAEARGLYRQQAKAADAAADAPRAFAATMAMNRATPDFDQWRARGAAFRAELRQLAETITPEWSARLPDARRASARVSAFLVGFPRSGTTLLDTFLLGHRDVTVLEERGLLVAAAGALGSLPNLPGAGAERLARAAQAYDDRLAAALDQPPPRCVIDKAPLNMLLAPLIEVLFGKIPILFAQRHPCDTVLSGFMQSFTPNLGMASFLDLADAADFYDAAMQLWTRCVEVLKLNTHTVVYEELIADPAGALRPAVAFLGLDWDPALLDHQATARTRGPIFNPSQDQVTQPLSAYPVGRWHRYEEQLAPVLPVLLPWADRLGYAR